MAIRRSRRSEILLSAAATLLGVVAFPARSQAAQREWLTASGGTFGDPVNWSGGLVPTAADTALFNLGPAAAYTVSFATSHNGLALRVPNNAVTLDLNGNSYNLRLVDGDNQVYVGEQAGDVASLTILDGTLLSRPFNIGAVGAPATVTIGSGANVEAFWTYFAAGSTLNLTGGTYKGGGGTISLAGGGTLNINGGHISLGNLQPAGGTFNWTAGTIEFPSSLPAPGLLIGTAGPFGSSLTLGPGRGLVSSANPIYLDAGATLALDGGSLTVRSFDGPGTFTFLRGALNLRPSNAVALIGPGNRIASLNLAAGDSLSAVHTLNVRGGTASPILTASGGATVTVSDFSHINAAVALDGAGTMWNSYYIRVGTEAGAASFTVSNGALVSAQGFGVGFNMLAQAEALITGGGSTLTTGSASVGFSSPGSGTARLTISNGGALTAATLFGVYPGGTLLLDGGSLTASEITTQPGAVIQWPSGTIHLTHHNPSLPWLAALANPAITPGRTLIIPGSTAIHAGQTLTVDGGRFSTGGISNNGTFTYLSGELELTNSPLVIGGASATIPSPVVLAAGDRLASSQQISTTGTLVLNGGAIVTPILSVGSGGSVAVNSGSAQFESLAMGGGTYTAPDLVIGSGFITGFGSVNADVTNTAGVVDPHGFLPVTSGALIVRGDYEQGASATFRAQLQRFSLLRGDVLDIDGTATLDGTLLVTLGSSAANFLEGDSFDVLRAGLIDGTFAQHQLPSLPGSLSFLVSYSATAVTLTVVPEPGSVGTVLVLPMVLMLRRCRRTRNPSNFRL